MRKEDSIPDSIEGALVDLEHFDFAQEVRDRGIPSYTKEGDLPKGAMLKTYPDGRREVVSYNEKYTDEIVLEYLSDQSF